jgi:dienelactone hydrolase
MRRVPLKALAGCLFLACAGGADSDPSARDDLGSGANGGAGGTGSDVVLPATGGTGGSVGGEATGGVVGTGAIGGSVSVTGGAAGSGGAFGGDVGDAGPSTDGSLPGACAPDVPTLSDLPGCMDCVCTECQAELDACLASDSCRYVLGCVIASGCQGAGCYTAISTHPDACGDLADHSAGFDLAIALRECRTEGPCASVCVASLPDAGSGGAGGEGGAGGASGGSPGETGGAAGTTGGAGGTGGCGPDPTETSASTRGTFTVATYTNNLSSSAYGSATVYYPTNAPGTFPGVAVSPGYTETQSAINGWGTFLASHCFVVLTFNTNSSLAQPPSRAQALLGAIDTLRKENDRGASPIFGKVNTDKFVVMGHSMGGGGALIAANGNPWLAASIPFTPWNSNSNFGSTTVPTLIIAGQSDTIAPVNSHAWPFYQAIPGSTKKVYMEISGGSHSVANNPLGTSARARLVARYGLSWLKVHADDDLRYLQFIQPNAGFSRYASTL